MQTRLQGHQHLLVQHASAIVSQAADILELLVELLNISASSVAFIPLWPNAPESSENWCVAALLLALSLFPLAAFVAALLLALSLFPLAAFSGRLSGSSAASRFAPTLSMFISHFLIKFKFREKEDREST